MNASDHVFDTSLWKNGKSVASSQRRKRVIERKREGEMAARTAAEMSGKMEEVFALGIAKRVAAACRCRRRRRLLEEPRSAAHTHMRPSECQNLLAMERRQRQGCQMANFDPFLSLHCGRVEGVGAQSKERKGSNFAA